MTRRYVLKFGGELLETRERMATAVSAVAAIVRGGVRVVVVHGGGKEIDAALRTAGIEKRQVDGLRITDAATLDVVVSVLAGAINTRFVAALNAAGVAAVGLTGADARCGLSTVAPPHGATGGRTVDLGRVGLPSPGADVALLDTLTAHDYVPVVACIGATSDGELLNVNADTLAGFLAARLGAARLVIAGATPGVLNAEGTTIAALDAAAMAALVADGTATAGMIAKLRACEQALSGGVDDVVIVDGRDRDALVAATIGEPPITATRVSATAGLKACATGTAAGH